MYPTLEQIRNWLQVSVSALPDEQLAVIRDGEIADQLRVCRVEDDGESDPAIPAPLIEALYRRCARAVAARGVPLGYIQMEDGYGAQTMMRVDSEVQRLEGPWRKFNFA